MGYIRNIWCLILLCVSSFASAQSIDDLTTQYHSLTGRYSLKSVTQVTDSTYLTVGQFLDYRPITTPYTVDSITTGMYVWTNNCEKWLIDSIGTKSNSTIQLRVKGKTTNDTPSIGHGSIIDYQYGWPSIPVGITAHLESCIWDDFMYLLDQDISTLVSTVPGIDSTTISNDSIFVWSKATAYFTGYGALDEGNITGLVNPFGGSNILSAIVDSLNANLGSGSESAVQVDSIAQILNGNYPVGSRIVSKGLDGKGEATFIVESSAVSGYTTDTFAVIPTINSKYAIVQPNDYSGYKVEWFGAKGDGITDDRIAIERGNEYTTLPSVRKPLVFNSVKTYVAKMPIRGSFSNAQERYIFNVRTGQNWIGSIGNETQKAKIHFKPPSTPTKLGNANLSANAFLIDNVSETIDSIHFEGIHFFVSKDTMVLMDTTLNNVITAFYDYDSSNSEDSNDWSWVNCTFENWSSVAIANQSAIVNGILDEGNTYLNIGGTHCGFSGSPANSEKINFSDKFVWSAVSDKDTIFVNQYGDIFNNWTAAYWFEDGDVVHRASISDYTAVSSYLDTILYYSNDTIFLRNNNTTADSIVIHSESVTLDRDKWKIVQSADLDFSPSKNVTVRNNNYYGGMATQSDHYIYSSRSVDNYRVENNNFYFEQSSPGVYDLTIRKGAGVHVRGGSYENVIIQGNFFSNGPTTDIHFGALDNSSILNNSFVYNDYAPAFPNQTISASSSHSRISFVNNMFKNETEGDITAFNGASSFTSNTTPIIKVEGGFISGFTDAFKLNYSDWDIQSVRIESPDSSYTTIRGENNTGRDRDITIRNVEITQKSAVSTDGSASNGHIISAAKNLVIDNLREVGEKVVLRVQGGENTTITNNQIGTITIGYDPGTLPDSGRVVIKDNIYSAILYGQSGSLIDSIFYQNEYVDINGNRRDTVITINSSNQSISLYDTKRIYLRDDGTSGRSIGTVSMRAMEPSGFVPLNFINLGENAIELSSSGTFEEDFSLGAGESIFLFYDVKEGSIKEYPNNQSVVWEKASDNSISYLPPAGDLAGTGRWFQLETEFQGILDNNDFSAIRLYNGLRTTGGSTNRSFKWFTNQAYINQSQTLDLRGIYELFYNNGALSSQDVSIADMYGLTTRLGAVSGTGSIDTLTGNRIQFFNGSGHTTSKLIAYDIENNTVDPIDSIIGIRIPDLSGGLYARAILQKGVQDTSEFKGHILLRDNTNPVSGGSEILEAVVDTLWEYSYKSASTSVQDDDIITWPSNFDDYAVWYVESEVTSSSSSDNDIVLEAPNLVALGQTIIIHNDDTDTALGSEDNDTAISSSGTIKMNGLTISGYIMATGETVTIKNVLQDGVYLWEIVSSSIKPINQYTITTSSPTIYLERDGVYVFDAASQGATTNTLNTGDLEIGDQITIIILGADSNTSTLDLSTGDFIYDTLSGDATEAFTTTPVSLTGIWDGTDMILK